MSIILRDSQKKYILDWDEGSSQLKVNEFTYGIWNQETQKYNMNLSSTTYIGDVTTNLVQGGRNEILNMFPVGSFINFLSGSRNCLREFGSHDISSLVSGGRYSG